MVLALIWLTAMLLARAVDAVPSPQAYALTSETTKPNIILFLTDDQDVVLGGWSPMTKAHRLLAEQGTMAKNWFIHTPVCCPSRAELLTGRYFHNIKVPHLNDKSCMHAHTDPAGPFTEWLFAPHLAQQGYKVGLFGKYLNTDVPTKNPPGISEWLANGGGDYFNPSFAYNGKQVTFNNGTFSNYSTSVIGNISTAWIRTQMQQHTPFFAYIAPKAPHIQDGPGWPKALPAPWYEQVFDDVSAPRTPNYNRSCPDHHWLIAQQPPMTSQQEDEMDELYRSRWRSLLSVDDLVEAVVSEVQNAGQLNNTYFLYTSDHGFRFGNFRMPQGKWNVYENDVRIPFVARGPGIRPNTTFDFIGSNVDVMPTVLGLAGVDTPDSMDGKSIAPLLIDATDEGVPASTRKQLSSKTAQSQSWRTMQLIEYYGLGDVVRYEHLEDTFNNTFRAVRAIDPSLGNFMLAEFTDVRTNYNFTDTPYFKELYDLDKDPHQLNNIYDSAPDHVKKTLTETLHSLYNCRGSNCN